MILFRLFAHHKGGGSTKNGRDSNAKRLGIKTNDGQSVSAGSINCEVMRKAVSVGPSYLFSIASVLPGPKKMLSEEGRMCIQPSPMSAPSS